MNKIVKAVNSTNEYKIIATINTNLAREIISNQKLVCGFSNVLVDCVSATMLMSNNLKEAGEEIALEFEFDGMIKKVYANGNVNNEYNGYIELNTLPANSILGDNGYLNVSRFYNKSLSWSSRVDVNRAKISEVIVDYYYQSEQIYSAMLLASLVDKKSNELYVSGGILIQLLPNCSDETIEKLELQLSKIDNLSKEISVAKNEEDLVYLIDSDAKILEVSDATYNCFCSRESMYESLMLIDSSELKTIIEEDGGISAICNSCNKKYVFKKEEFKF